ncbi:MAG: DUF502 domain-containing protein [Chitinophagaceae bacterium]|nr:MAG: DUF502 domain-containing protein [Chitinophagaceae bacterium]
MTPTTAERLTYKKLLRYFVQGILILAPIAITGYLLYWLFDKVDSILRPVVNIPGLGFLIILVFVLLVGYVSTNFLMGSILGIFDSWLERTPGVKFIYTSVKDFFEAFAGDKRKFDKPIVVNVLAEDVWLVGFLTNEDLHRFEMGAEYVSAYVPQGYNIAGQVYLVKRERIKRLTDLTASEAMKFAVTGGVIHFDDEKNTVPKK